MDARQNVQMQYDIIYYRIAFSFKMILFLVRKKEKKKKNTHLKPKSLIYKTALKSSEKSSLI